MSLDEACAKLVTDEAAASAASLKALEIRLEAVRASLPPSSAKSISAAASGRDWTAELQQLREEARAAEKEVLEAKAMAQKARQAADTCGQLESLVDLYLEGDERQLEALVGLVEAREDLEPFKAFRMVREKVQTAVEEKQNVQSGLETADSDMAAAAVATSPHCQLSDAATRVLDSLRAHLAADTELDAVAPHSVVASALECQRLVADLKEVKDVDTVVTGWFVLLWSRFAQEPSIPLYVVLLANSLAYLADQSGLQPSTVALLCTGAERVTSTFLERTQEELEAHFSEATTSERAERAVRQSMHALGQVQRAWSPHLSSMELQRRMGRLTGAVLERLATTVLAAGELSVEESNAWSAVLKSARTQCAGPKGLNLEDMDASEAHRRVAGGGGLAWTRVWRLQEILQSSLQTVADHLPSLEACMSNNEICQFIQNVFNDSPLRQSVIQRLQ